MRAWLLVLTVGLLTTACADPVPESTLTGVKESISGPAYVGQTYDGGQPRWTVVAGNRVRALDSGVNALTWQPDGHLLVWRMRSLSSLDPATGNQRGRYRLKSSIYDAGTTPGSVTLREGQTALVVLTPDLRVRRRITVPSTAVQTDQIGDGAEFHLHHQPLTLDDVTWTQWSINSEDDTLTDHGVLRIERDQIVEVLRNQPVVSLRASSDGRALLVIMQDNGESQNCGGCAVEQKVVELDPATGRISADYEMPPGYTRHWRIERVDKVGRRIAVQFRIGEAGEGPHPPRWQTWVYDGRWTELSQRRDRRVIWQAGGRMEWRQTDLSVDEGEGASYQLLWRPTSGPAEDLSDQLPCPAVDHDQLATPRVKFCQVLQIPGSLLR